MLKISYDPNKNGQFFKLIECGWYYIKGNILIVENGLKHNWILELHWIQIETERILITDKIDYIVAYVKS